MEVITEEGFSSYTGSKLAIAIGSFDGLHLGHRAIIDKLIDIAVNNNLRSGIFSFSPHPQQVMAPKSFPGLLISEEQKYKLLGKMGIDLCFVRRFNQEFAKIGFEKFVKKILVDKLHVREIIVGDDFKFGYKRTGDIRSLQELGQKYSFQVTVVKPIKKNNHKVSSTLIRKLISSRKISSIPDYLGRYYQLQGQVISGQKLGQKMGIPTANLELVCDYVLPPYGVYAVYVHYRGREYKGIMNMGNRPTFPDADYSLEVHILDFDDNLYGQKLSVDLVEFIRKEKYFSGPEELIKQIKKDILYTRSSLFLSAPNIIGDKL